jgi:hypothetical protein
MDQKSARAAIIDELNVTGGTPSERFDRVTRLARDLLDAPMAYLNLVDDTTLHTLTPNPGGRHAMPAVESFCAHTVLQDQPFVVADTLTDQRSATLPAVRAHGIRFYAGAPVRVAGTRVGSVCVMDTQPRQLPRGDITLLQDLASWAGKILTEHVAAPSPAGDVAPAHLPPAVILKGYDLYADSVPFEELSGDFYDWAATDVGVRFTLGDVMGKGAAAALLAASVRSTLHATTGSPVSAVVAAEATIGVELMRAESFATIFHAELNSSSGDVTYADAGHGIAVHLPLRTGLPQVLRSRDLPLGLHPSSMPRSSGSLRLEPGDVLIVCSDGVLDLFDGTLTALHKLAEFYRIEPDRAAFLSAVRALIARKRPEDDVTVLVLARHR